MVAPVLMRASVIDPIKPSLAKMDIVAAWLTMDLYYHLSPRFPMRRPLSAPTSNTLISDGGSINPHNLEVGHSLITYNIRGENPRKIKWLQKKR